MVSFIFTSFLLLTSFTFGLNNDNDTVQHQHEDDSYFDRGLKQEDYEEDVVILLQKTDQYIETLLENPQHLDIEKIRRTCQNRYRLCTYWASLGECYINWFFMIRDCPLACRSCVGVIALKEEVVKSPPTLRPLGMSPSDRILQPSVEERPHDEEGVEIEESAYENDGEEVEDEEIHDEEGVEYEGKTDAEEGGEDEGTKYDEEEDMDE